ncbi:MAG: hypothetical protein ACRYFU_03090 [Janthinobacterium lividum]
MSAHIKNLAPAPEKVSLFRFFGLLGLVVSLGAAISLRLLQYRFGGYDLSPLIDSGWRVHLGQVPNRDFICTFPPILYLGVDAAFRCFGISWFAVTLAGVLYPTALTFAGFRLLSLLCGVLEDQDLRWLTVIYASLQMIPLFAVGHPWHSSWTEATSLYAVLTTFTIVVVGSEYLTVKRELVIHLSIAEAFLLLAKPNVGVPTLLLCFVTLALSRNTSAALQGLVGGFTLSSLALSTARTNLFTTYTLYAQLTSRFRPGHYLAGILYERQLSVGVQACLVYALLIPVFAWLVSSSWRRTRRFPLWAIALFMGSGMVTILGIGTNVELKVVDPPCFLLSAALMVALRPPAARFGKVATSVATYTLLGMAALYGVTRVRMQDVGVWANTCSSLETRHDRFFGPFTSCPDLFSVLEETDNVVSANQRKSVFFGPRMEFLYARERLASPLGMPLWWHPGTSYPDTDVQQIVAAFRRDHVDLLIFLHGDRTRMPKQLLDVMDQEYVSAPHSLAAYDSGLMQSKTAHVDLYVRRQ